jgi:hypothetical protein
MSANSERVKNWRRETKRKILEISGGKCTNCGYNKCPDALEFHHIDPSTKDFTFGSVSAHPKSWDKILQELQKCLLLCSNCHREVHAGVLSIDTLIGNRQLLIPKPRPDKIVEECPICKSLKPIDLTYCSAKCSDISKRKVDWSSFDLSEHLKTKNNSQIARELNVSETTIRKHKRKLLRLIPD